MSKNDKWTPSVMLLWGTLLGVASGFAHPLANVRAATPSRPQLEGQGDPAAPAGNAVAAAKRTLREREGWTTEEFFEGAEAIGACKAISDRDQKKLEAMIEKGLDVNLTGKAGMALLHWAFVEDNFAAFELLLKSKADPDKKLTSSVILNTSRHFLKGDSVPFTCLRSLWKGDQYEFFFAALSHSKDKDPRDAVGNTLLLVGLSPISGGGLLSKEALARVLKLGVNLDAQTEHGTTAAMTAIWWDRPQLALQILEAGADPSIRNAQGRTVADLLRLRIARERERGEQDLARNAAPLLEWLEKHPKGLPAAPAKP